MTHQQYQQQQTIYTHKWFVTQFTRAESKLNHQEILLSTNNILFILFVGLVCTWWSYTQTHNQFILVVRFILAFIYAKVIMIINQQGFYKKREAVVYMRFAQNDIHYVFIGTEKQLEKAFNQLRLKNECVPLDDDDNKNYTWSLYSYDTYKELKESICISSIKNIKYI